MKTKLTAPYGRIYMDILKRNDLTPKQKLIYAVVAIKQGESDFALLSNIMIADAIGCTPRYVSSSFKKMEDLKLLVKLKRGKIQVQPPKGAYGMVELDMLITTNISSQAKFLYLIYCASGNDFDANIWGRKNVCSEFQISYSTYQKAHKELLDKEILQTIGRTSGNGIQTSNINIIIRTDSWEIKRPPSWIPSEGFDLDKWCLKNLDEEGRVLPEPADFGKNEGTEDTTQMDETVQRTLTINSNPNSKPISSNQLITNENLAIHTSEPSEGGLDTNLLEEVLNSKLRTPKEARHAIDTLNKNGFEGVASPYLTDDTIERAFKAFQYFKEAVERYDKDTIGYALNIDDLNNFTRSALRDGYSYDEIEYHIGRVVQLGFEKMKKPYIGFGYVIAARNGVHLEFKVKGGKKAPV